MVWCPLLTLAGSSRLSETVALEPKPPPRPAFALSRAIGIKKQAAREGSCCSNTGFNNYDLLTRP